MFDEGRYQANTPRGELSGSLSSVNNFSPPFLGFAGKRGMYVEDVSGKRLQFIQIDIFNGFRKKSK
jgi:hypothetical protein